MHRQILRAPPGIEVDHWDRDGLNNTRQNLRQATRSQNAANTAGHANRSGRFKGAYRHAQCPTRWMAAIRVSSTRLYLGLYSTEEEAARAYDRAAREHFGEFARLNFPL